MKRKKIYTGMKLKSTITYEDQNDCLPMAWLIKQTGRRISLNLFHFILERENKREKYIHIERENDDRNNGGDAGECPRSQKRRVLWYKLFYLLKSALSYF